jgi:serine protease
MKSKRAQALVLAMSVVLGYAGAAVFSAWAGPAVPIATGYGPHDGLTRYVLTASAGPASDDLLAALERTEGVVHAQRLSDGRALVATEGLAPHHLEAMPGVAEADFSTTVPVLGTVTDPYFSGYGWNLDNTGSNAYGQYAVAGSDVDAPEGWDAGAGAGMIIAVVDTGYDSDHPDLVGALWTNPAEPCGSVDVDGNGKAGDCHGWNFTNGTPDVDNGTYGSHGTSVAGVAAARAGNGAGNAGVAPEVTIMPLVIGSGDRVDMNLGAEAIRYAVDHGADVITASWGGGANAADLANLRSAIRYAGDNGVLVVAAAGNDSANRDHSLMYPASLDEPGLVTVGNSNAADRMSGSSAYGELTVDLFAPGELVFTTWNDDFYRLVSGTSIAAPQVAAAYALYRAAWPAATTAELRQALLDDVEPVAAFVGRSVTGGRLSVASLAEGALGAVRYTFASMSAPAGVVTPEVTAAGEDAPGAYAVTLGLGMAHEGEIWAVADKEIALGGVTVTTDDRGEAQFDLGTAATLGELALSPSLTLGDGRYVLSVQLHRDGEPLGREFAAPLLIGAAAVAEPDGGRDSSGGSGDGSDSSESPGGSDSGSDGSGSDGSGSDGSGSDGSGSDGSGSDGSGVPEPDGSGGSDSPSTDSPGSGGSGDGSGGSDSSGSGDGSGDGPGPDGSGSDGSSDGSGDPGSEPTGTGDGSDSGGSSESDAGGSDGSGDGPGDGSGSGDSGGSSGDGGSVDEGTGDDGGTITYPGVGPFLITSISPTRVDVSGGTLVTITGNALPTNPAVRVGDAAAATVVRSSATELVFRTPARIAGVYDVHVFAPDGRNSTLADALTYVADAPSSDDGSDSSTDPGDSGDGSDGTSGGGSDAGSDSGSDSGSDGGSSAPAGPVTTTGPNGERLVRTSKFAALGSLWSMDCSVSCSGVAI